MQDYVFNDEEIKMAISKIEQKNSFISKIKDMDLLRNEITKVDFTKKKPESTDDSMESPATYNIQNLCNISAGVLYSNPKCIRL